MLASPAVLWLSLTTSGRISYAGFIPKKLVYASTRDTTSTSTVAVGPESVLFRQKNAPTRYAESDVYFANERELKTELPDSDLLKALHCYTSDFYSRTTPRGGAGNWRSMNGTALLALGILMEEATRDVLGQTGDLVFTEGEDRVAPPTTVPAVPSAPDRHGMVRRRRRRPRKGSDVNGSHVHASHRKGSDTEGSDIKGSDRKGRPSKKRRLG